MQGMGFIVAMLLLHMPEEQAFWTFAALMRDPEGKGTPPLGPQREKGDRDTLTQNKQDIKRKDGDGIPRGAVKILEGTAKISSLRSMFLVSYICSSHPYSFQS